MKIVLFSDSHVGCPASDWTAYFDKRWVGVFNYFFRRQFQHDQTLLVKVVDYILRLKPDIAICTGDITSAGQPAEFEKTIGILSPLVQVSDIRFLFVPGNHDYYVKNKRCYEAMKSAFSFLNGGNLAFEGLPQKIIIGDCEFLVVNESWPTNLISSCGYLMREDSRKICRWCSEKSSRPIILVGHYPIIEKHPFLRIRHRLWGQRDIALQLERGNIDISLCGHFHKPYARLNERGRGEICAGSVTRNACIAVIEYNKNKDVFEYEKVTFCDN